MNIYIVFNDDRVGYEELEESINAIDGVYYTELNTLENYEFKGGGLDEDNTN